MRLALIEANEGRGGTFADQVRLLCSAFDPAQGIYTVAISRTLAGLGVITTVLLAGGIGWLALADRRTT
jgi:protein SCO1/2